MMDAMDAYELHMQREQGCRTGLLGAVCEREMAKGTYTAKHVFSIGWFEMLPCFTISHDRGRT